MEQAMEFDDKIVFRSSLNQRLHIQINSIRSTLHMEEMAMLFIKNEVLHLRVSNNEPPGLHGLLRAALSFHNSDTSAFSEQVLHRLEVGHSDKLLATVQ